MPMPPCRFIMMPPARHAYMMLMLLSFRRFRFCCCFRQILLFRFIDAAEFAYHFPRAFAFDTLLTPCHAAARFI